MSIIYDALTKTQTERDKTTQSVKVNALKQPNFWFRLIVIPLFFLLSFIMAYIVYQDLFVATPKQTMLLEGKQKLNFNGAFLAGNEKYAMINNHSYKLGDKVDSRTIVSIDLNSVRLRDEVNQNLTTLRIAL